MSIVTVYTRESIIQAARQALDLKPELPGVYKDRLEFELSEIDKQGAFGYWENILNEEKKFKENPNKLVLPWLLGVVDDDPLDGQNDILCTAKFDKIKEYSDKIGSIPSYIIKDQDMPDIDLDCIPEARDPIKSHAAKVYGSDCNDEYGSVCSVGTWQTYKLRSAIIDVARATNIVDKSEAYDLTTNLPDDVDDLKDGGASTCKHIIIDSQTNEENECGHIHACAVCPECGGEETEGPTIGKLLAEFDDLSAFETKYPDVIAYAVRLVGRIRTMGMHAGALIIADRPLYGNIPMAKSARHGYWVSMWTEGRNTQLSKFGYNKWDILGLKNLKYIFTCCKLIEQNRGISFGKNMSGWDDIDPISDRAGHYFKNGKKRYISLNDHGALKLANEAKTDAIFQFDTDLAKRILGNGVKNFHDLMLLNAMGHPGPMASIPEAVKNRDDKKGTWKNRLHEDILPILEDTYGVIVYQEQLQAIWQKVGGFTAPEAQEARKAVAKKWVHKLRPIQQKWMEGASKKIGNNAAEEWWEKMETFGRYAFNKSHSVAYCLVAYRCLWLKAHFAPEWWAAVMSDCHPDKLIRYMGVARSEGTEFGTLDANNLTVNFSVSGDIVLQGLIGIKKIGEKAAGKFAGDHDFKNVDEFVESMGKNKIVMERLIKLGAFKDMKGHGNNKAVWMWYQYKYCSGVVITQLRKEIKQKLLDTDGKGEQWVKNEIKRQIIEYKRIYPKRNKIPNKILNFRPTPDDIRDRVMALYKDNFHISEILEFEQEFLGYYINSPLELYQTIKGRNIEGTKKAYLRGEDSIVEAVITNVEYAKTKNDTTMCKLTITDGVQNILLIVWERALRTFDKNILSEGVGISAPIEYDEQRRSFSLARGEVILRLIKREL
jgi:DNA polymerase III alpha subunit